MAFNSSSNSSTTPTTFGQIGRVRSDSPTEIRAFNFSGGGHREGFSGGENHSSMILPPSLDSPNEFPSLGGNTSFVFKNSFSNSSNGRKTPLSPSSKPRQPYVHSVLKPERDSRESTNQNQNQKVSEFSIENEDFPALPKTPASVPPPQQQPQNHQFSSSSAAENSSIPEPASAPTPPPADNFSLGALIQKLRDPRFSKELFFMIGLDISAVNIDLNNKQQIYRSYPGPFNEKKLKMDQIDHPVPAEYVLTGRPVEPARLPPLNSVIRANYPNLEDLLFFLFYFYAGEHMQEVAARELYGLGWRFYLDEGLWFLNVEGAKAAHHQAMATGPPANLFGGGAVTPTSEHGTYVYWDPVLWKRNAKEMTVRYDRLVVPTCSLLSANSDSGGDSGLEQQLK